MLRKAELEELKTEAARVEARLQLLRNRIRDMERGLHPGTLMAVVDEAKCIGCGACRDVCPTRAIFVDKVALVDSRRCIGCGRCIDGCPKGALSLCFVDQRRSGQAAL